MERGCLICLPRLPALPRPPAPALPSVYIPIFIHSLVHFSFILSSSTCGSIHIRSAATSVGVTASVLLHQIAARICLWRGNPLPQRCLLPSGSAAATAFPYNYLFRLLTLFLSPYSYSIDVASAAVAVVVLIVVVVVVIVVVVVGVSSIVVVILKVLLCRTRISPVRFGFLTDFRRKYDVVSPLIMCFTERERRNQTKVGNTHIGIPFSQDCDIDIIC